MKREGRARGLREGRERGKSMHSVPLIHSKFWHTYYTTSMHAVNEIVMCSYLGPLKEIACSYVPIRVTNIRLHVDSQSCGENSYVPTKHVYHVMDLTSRFCL